MAFYFSNLILQTAVVKNGEVQQLAEKNGVPVMKYSGKNPKQIKRLYIDLSIDPSLN